MEWNEYRYPVIFTTTAESCKKKLLFPPTPFTPFLVFGEMR